MHPVYCAVLAFVLLASTAIAGAAMPQPVPESGIYWSPTQVGTGYILETQGDTFAFSIYAYGLDGDPEFFIASGRISEGYSAPLFRVTGGAMLGSNSINETGAGLNAERVGRVALSYHVESPQILTYTALFLYLTLDSPPDNEPPETLHALQRMNFGYGGFGNRSQGQCWPDMRGEWAFLDKSDASRPPWRFRFTQATSTPSSDLKCERPGDDHVLTFRDVVAGAELRCVFSSDAPDPLDGLRKYSGCELRRDGSSAVVFSFYVGDIGLGRMIGSSGPLTVIGSGVEPRSTGNILGIRAD